MPIRFYLRELELEHANGCRNPVCKHFSTKLKMVKKYFKYLIYVSFILKTAEILSNFSLM